MAEIMQVEDQRLTRVLSYPTYCEEKYKSVVEELKAMSVDCIVSTGRLELGGLRVLGKGCVGVVLAGNVHGTTIALKVLRSDANRQDLLGEAGHLAIANRCGAGPKLIASAKRVIAMDYIDGGYLTRWLREPRTKKEITQAVRRILRQCYDLDRLGLDHGELSDAKKHILVDSHGSPFIIDFETASTKRRTRNLISILSYMFLKEPVASRIGEQIRWKEAAFVNSIKGYKCAPSKITYEAILSTINFGD